MKTQIETDYENLLLACRRLLDAEGNLCVSGYRMDRHELAEWEDALNTLRELALE